ncbi:type II toxin-antitoxin system HicA family toxin [Nocardiopsis sp. JB363]|uniref:type II toxin-antitoxin system HicA family toxin n=1 Tax=Nocardiopsis sp. JB363 TaxID=1434837 RepID=UPI000B3567CE|nr:type II toxin-antitoxin system HicA family toxin [Nocardiopsis sp. JB363]
MSPSHTPIVSGLQVIAALKNVGYGHVRTKGSHAVLRFESRVVVVPLHKELKRGTTASILRKTGMTVDQLRDLL